MQSIHVKMLEVIGGVPPTVENELLNHGYVKVEFSEDSSGVQRGGGL
jgi:hypothetical protein